MSLITASDVKLICEEFIQLSQPTTTLNETALFKTIQKILK